jgi:hypothetical protein
MPAAIFPPLEVGDTFDTFAEFKEALHRWSVSANFETKMQQSNRKVNVVTCRLKPDTCDFRVRAMWKAAVQKVNLAPADALEVRG